MNKKKNNNMNNTNLKNKSNENNENKNKKNENNKEDIITNITQVILQDLLTKRHKPFLQN